MNRAALFDVDGTLADTNHLHVVCWWEALRQAGHDVAMHDIHRAIGLPGEDLLAHVLGEHRDTSEDDRLSAAHSTLYGTYFDRLPPLQAAADLLRELDRRGWRVVLVTSATDDELDALRRAVGGPRPPVYPGEATRDVAADEGGFREGGDETPTDREAGTGPAQAGTDEPLLGAEDTAEYHKKWSEIQSRFVDDPQDAVTSADALVAEVMQSLARTFSAHKQGLEEQWGQGEQVATEELRLALQHYRSFFNRLRRGPGRRATARAEPWPSGSVRAWGVGVVVQAFLLLSDVPSHSGKNPLYVVGAVRRLGPVPGSHQSRMR
ncbi:hypothetical protein Snoj_30080 [Streptomyces nojiriensis]|uniref:HAD family hydrolase n=1 Tax=Streptomyces nojiriensis TaxID=66374 RepID=A0ABQ3SMN1_9ACTN|nr:Phosphoglycolate phosphatase [Streptomyces nojiriensis]GGS16031.1 hypothetical protein GCM10010205_52260 [Streptomyces nojiriensis]GHI69090.1 hypothetical protein Snoj_30080 [Streptomyces nojiriensis]